MASRTSTLTVSLVDDVSRPARTVATALRQAESEVKAVSKAMAASGGGSDRLVTSLAKLKASKADIEAVANAWRDYAKANALADDASQWTKAQAAQVAAWERQTIASVRAVTAERRAEGRAQAQLMREQQQQAEQTAHQRRRWTEGDKSMAAMLGAAAVGGGMVEAARHTIKEAAEAEQLRFRIRELSRSNPAEARDADAVAAEIAAKYPSITVGKALDNYLELRANAVNASGVVDPVVARRNAFAAAKAQNSALAIGAEMTPEDMQNLLKGVEGSGRADDPRAVDKITDAYLKAKQVFGTAIASSMVRDYVANAKSANFSVGEDQFYLQNMVRMSEGNASRLGNEVNQTLSTLVGGSMKKAAGKWLIEHGLASASDMENTGGGNVRFRRGIKDSDVLQVNQGKWAAGTLKASIEAGDALSEKNVSARMALLRKENPEEDDRFLRHRAEEGLIAAEIAKTGWRPTVTDNLAHLIGNERLIERDVAALKAASGAEAGERIKENAIAAFKEFTASLDNFATVVGSPAMQMAGPILDRAAHSIADFTKGVGDWAKANPALAKGASVTAIGVGLVGGGALTYGALSGLMGGFGLKGSAVALDGAAAELSAAAATLKGGSAAPGGPGVPGAPGGGKGIPGLGWLRTGAFTVEQILNGLNAPYPGKKGGAGEKAWSERVFQSDKEINAEIDKVARQLIGDRVVDKIKSFNAMPFGGKVGTIVNGGWTPTLPNWHEPERPIPGSPSAMAAPPPDYSASINEVDTFGIKLGEATAKAQELHDAASQTATPQVDVSSLDNAIAKANQLKAVLAGLGASIAGAIPSLGPVVRGNFTASGVGHQ